MMKRWIAGLLAALFAIALLAVPATSAHGRFALRSTHRSLQNVIAHVDFLHYRLAINGRPGPVDAPLLARANLSTSTGEVAAVRYPDEVRQRINEETDAILESSTLMLVLRGEVSPIGTSATQRRIRHAGTTASSLGTEYDLRIAGRESIYTVRQGLLQVANKHGQVLVRPSQQTIVIDGHAPARPRHIANVNAIFAWTDTLPAPDVGEDAGLDANGGRIFAVPSRGGQWGLQHINDGLIGLGWESAAGHTHGQQIKMEFTPDRLYRIAAVIIDPAATGGDPSSMDLKRFEIRVSTTNTSESSFVTVFYGQCQRKNALQEFKFPSVPLARYVELDVLSNYGNRQRVAIAEWEVVAATSGFSTPYGIALDRSGNIYVADTGNSRIVKLSPLGLPLASWGSKGSGLGRFNFPMGVAVGPKGNIYVADSGNNRIVKLSASGKPLLAWGSYGGNLGQFKDPESVAADSDGNIYVLDGVTHRIEEFTPTGRPLLQWRLYWPGSLVSAHSIAVGPNGDVYVGDRGARSNQIQVFSARGKLLAQRATSGLPGPSGEGPAGVAADRHGNVYVDDAALGVIQKFAKLGTTLVATWKMPHDFQWTSPGQDAVDGAGNIYFVDQLLDRVVKLAPNGTVEQLWGVYGDNTQSLGAPHGLALDRQGDVYITDWVHKGVQRRLTNGQVVAFFGHPANLFTSYIYTPGAFFDPFGVAVHRGVIYVADPYSIQVLTNYGPIGVIRWPQRNVDADFAEIAVDSHGNIYGTRPDYNDVAEITPKGKVLALWGGQGTRPGRFDFPTGIAIGSHGTVYVVDYNNNRVEVFSSKGRYLSDWRTSTGGFGIAIDHGGNVYVAEGHPVCRVEEFTATGRYRRSFGAGCGVARNQISSIEDVAVDRQGDVYVADDGTNRVLKFSPRGKVLSIWD